jgi:hypothetical protein
MEIIVKKYGDSKRFVPHHNRELGKTYHDKRTYLSDMKSAGVEPYNPKSIRREDKKSYIRSDWAREMQNDIKNRKGKKPGDRFINELAKKGYTQKSAEKAMKIAREMK